MPHQSLVVRTFSNSAETALIVRPLPGRRWLAGRAPRRRGRRRGSGVPELEEHRLQVGRGLPARQLGRPAASASSPTRRRSCRRGDQCAVRCRSASRRPTRRAPASAAGSAARTTAERASASQLGQGRLLDRAALADDDDVVDRLLDLGACGSRPGWSGPRRPGRAGSRAATGCPRGRGRWPARRGSAPAGRRPARPRGRGAAACPSRTRRRGACARRRRADQLEQLVGAVGAHAAGLAEHAQVVAGRAARVEAARLQGRADHPLRLGQVGVARPPMVAAPAVGVTSRAACAASWSCRRRSVRGTP